MGGRMRLELQLYIVPVLLSLTGSFLQNCSSADHEANAMIKAQFISLWDGLESRSDCQVPADRGEGSCYSGANCHDFVMSLIIMIFFLKAPAPGVKWICDDFSLPSERKSQFLALMAVKKA
ncbi:unnamed protein product [Eretmochelys imbricata]